MQEQLRTDLKEAMKAHDTMKTTVLKGIIASCMSETMVKGNKPNEPLNDADVLIVIKREAKKRKDSIQQFEKGGRNDLAQLEKDELVVIDHYLPQQMSREEIQTIARAKKEELNVTDTSKLGILIGAILKETKGQADGALVKEVVEGLF